VTTSIAVTIFDPTGMYSDDPTTTMAIRGDIQRIDALSQYSTVEPTWTRERFDSAVTNSAFGCLTWASLRSTAEALRVRQGTNTDKFCWICKDNPDADPDMVG
jgi:hypothetical protein